MMSVLALSLYSVYLLVGFVWRTVVHVRRTGDHGFRGLSGRPGSLAWTAGVGFVVALLLGFAAPIADLGGLEPIGWLEVPWLQATGVSLAVLGTALTLAAQMRMGEQWRVGVDEAERTDLVVTGAFGLVRNPVFSAMGITGLGLALVVPNVVAAVAVVALAVSLELQVRRVEEPYLRTVHGVDYATYEASVGRFLPRLGLAGPALPAVTSGSAATQA